MHYINLYQRLAILYIIELLIHNIASYSQLASYTPGLKLHAFVENITQKVNHTYVHIHGQILVISKSVHHKYLLQPESNDSEQDLVNSACTKAGSCITS